jgi:PhnB protein
VAGLEDVVADVRPEHAHRPPEPLSRICKRHPESLGMLAAMTSYRPTGYSTLTPMIAVSPAAKAIDFYSTVFGAQVTARMDGPDGSVWHAELALEDGRLQVMDPNEQFHMVGQDPSSDDVRYSLAVYVPDVDATLAKATELGARVREPASDFGVTGDRFASVQDPFGVRWSIMTRRVETSDEQVQKNLDAWRESMG